MTDGGNDNGYDDEEFEVEDHGDGEEPAWFVKRSGDVVADVIWHRDDDFDPAKAKAPGYWDFSPVVGEQEEWRDLTSKGDEPDAISRAKDRLR